MRVVLEIPPEIDKGFLAILILTADREGFFHLTGQSSSFSAAVQTDQ
jgi:hypothetical protein